ncbi:MAG: hypothetical protein M1828_000112 [Chrysothrix sp. TS-e1954]|nr:MAG: hypothetical protein M1828_000112 [Chrysothrix sp. TS-e1954]
MAHDRLSSHPPRQPDSWVCTINAFLRPVSNQADDLQSVTEHIAMANNQRHGRPDEELFMRQGSSSSPNPPSIGPLRINKPTTPSGSSTTSGSGGQSQQQAYRRPHYSPPPSSPPTAPLPYPDDTNRQPYQTAAGAARYPSPSVQQHSQSPPTRFSPDSYARPSNTANSNAPYPHEGQYGYARPPDSSNSNAPKPLPESPGPETPEKDGILSRLPPHLIPQPTEHSSSSGAGPSQYYYPPPDSSEAAAGLRIPNPSSVNRLASTSSVSTTKAARGSPPPPETPVDGYPTDGGIEARYAAAGIAGTGTLNTLQAQSLAAQQRRQQYQSSAPPQDQNAQAPPSHPHSGQQAASTQADNPAQRRESQLEQDMGRMNVSEEPPPAYSSVSPATQRYPADKRNQGPQTTGSLAIGATTTQQPPEQQQSQSTPTQQMHPAFANDQTQAVQQPQPMYPQQTIASPATSQANSQQQQQAPQQTPSPAPSNLTSPPPLPEGWIAHVDPNSGQYYYIHLPTQATQWEFPKGPTPLDQAPVSPTGTMISNPFGSPTVSNFGGNAKPLASPGLASNQPPFRESMMTMSGMSSPTAAGFTVPPPSAGVDMYRIAPTNGVYFGPYLRYTNIDVEMAVWYGSLMLVTDSPHPPTIHLHQSLDLSPNPRQLKATQIHLHRRWAFYRYDIDVRMEDRETKWTYAITSHLGCTRYEFTVAPQNETSWRFIAHSGNDFALNVNQGERQKLGGVGYMWRDILQKHIEVGGFHAQVGMGNQIYADRLWKEIPSLRQWTAMSGKENRKNAQWSQQCEDEVTHAYFHYYTSHFDQPHLREAFAQIPHIMTIDDHDIFDGYGSYPPHMQFSHFFRSIFKVAHTAHLLFAHHTTPTCLSQNPSPHHASPSITSAPPPLDLFTITGTGYHLLKYLGPALALCCPDTRSERTPFQVLSGPTYQGLFPKIALLPPHVQHVLWVLPVPLVYPRFETAEHFAQTMATGKKAVTGTFNALGKVTSGVAGIMGSSAKGVVGDGFASVKKAVGKSGLMSNVLSPFGELDILDEVRDAWTHESHDLERTYLIRTLQGIASSKSLRVTFLSGSTNCAGAGILSSPADPAGHKTMFQIVSSSVVNAPPSQYVLRMLQGGGNAGSSSGVSGRIGGMVGSGGPGRPIYIPENGTKSRPDLVSDTKEDMLELFSIDVNGVPSSSNPGQPVGGQGTAGKRLMGRRNYAAFVSYDPEVVNEAFSQAGGSVKDANSVAGSSGTGANSVSLAVDFFVQSDPAQYAQGAAATVKYGPLTIPAVAPGH